MAKRKRLTLSTPPASVPGGPLPETEMHSYPNGVVPPRRRPAPIADVAGDAATVAALEEVTATLAQARAGGRLVLDLPLDAVDESYLVRDRVIADPDEMDTLRQSLAARGQQTPIEVTDLGEGRYGLISGWRRLRALRDMAAEQGIAGTVKALLRRPADAGEAYLAMIEENEIRVGLSYFERARIVLKAVEQGVFPDTRTALQALFAAASRSRRSKIGSFLEVVPALDGHLSHPGALGERLGGALGKALAQDAGLADRLRGALAGAAPADAGGRTARAAGRADPAAQGQGGHPPCPRRARPRAANRADDPGAPRHHPAREPRRHADPVGPGRGRIPAPCPAGVPARLAPGIGPIRPHCFARETFGPIRTYPAGAV